MRVLAVVPARGGSVGVPLKNLAHVGGTPLVARAVRACLRAELVDEVIVSTDHDGIAEAARDAGARVVERPAELSDPTASSESAVLHVLDQLDADPEVVILVQCTSPFIDPTDLDAAVAKVLDGRADVVFSGVATHEFLWSVTGAGINHDPAVRPRRQEREPEYRETGAFYVMRTAGLRERGHRFFGTIAVQEVPAAHAIEVDEPRDLEIVRALAPFTDEPEPIDVDAVITDFDGVHTDDRAYIDQHGREMVAVSRSDGLGIAMLRRSGVKVLIMSTEHNPVVSARARKLGVPVLQGLTDKRTVLRDWLEIEGLDPARVAYVGNDINDLGPMSEVGWPVAVPEAHPRVRAAARVLLTRPGGAGAVRELCDRVLAARPVEARPRTADRGTAASAPSRAVRPPLTAVPRSGASAPPVAVGDLLVGAGHPVYVIGEIGINHNGDLDIARRLIDVAAEAGCQAVKFQKRTPEICVPEEQRGQIRQTPWGEMTYLEYKKRTEFGREEYTRIAEHCAERGLQWFASPWDVPSVRFLEEMDVVAHKVPSAAVTDLELLRELASTGKPIILSTGMSTLEEIDRAVEILGTDKLIIMHATSTYPLPPEEANLRTILTLQERYGVPVGYSGHERGLQISLAAVTLGAVAVERHITLDRTMWGSDHAASLEPSGLKHLVRDIRIIETALGDGVKRVFPGEEAPKARLRRVTV
ncbi:N-acetylneuraminate synthase family protein [Thermostaphylospora chromogena]|uniref:N-acylneuraminate cytidylyltransferase n=1 Tax=Thermostaphylospora chromogena TaxID=35622 RepID=A0A1H1GNU6_9ACTN|nr:N-acetylneuraminate synthase family protein [Thermostaphylospora chromogena]SDR14588.1 3-deoxy-D-manno-octulosonate 8-phosphate phosphatase, YrbI family [Thermostaphylospora chromogena]